MSAIVPQLETEPIQQFEETQAEKSLKNARRLAIISLICGFLSLILAPLLYLYGWLGMDLELNEAFLYSCGLSILGFITLILGCIALVMAIPYKNYPVRRITSLIACLGIILGIGPFILSLAGCYFSLVWLTCPSC